MSRTVLLFLLSSSLAFDIQPQGPSKTCNKYSCKPDSMQFSGKDCIAYIQNTFYLKPCSMTDSDYYCPPITSPGNSTCTNPRIPVTKAYVGEPCSYDEMCYTNNCKNYFCYGFDQGESCADSSECNAGLYCKANVCKNQIPAGGLGCKSDYDCVNSAGCNFGTCISYLNLKEGSVLDSCPNNYNRLCASTSCTGTMCLPALTSSISKPRTCSNDENCSSNSWKDFSINSKCRCGFNPSGQSYCDLLPGDIEYQKYLQNLKAWITSPGILKCNTLRRFSDECMWQFWDIPIYDEYQYYAMFVANYPLIQNNDDCILKIYTLDYYNSKRLYDHDESGYMLSVVLASLLIYLL